MNAGSSISPQMQHGVHATGLRIELKVVELLVGLHHLAWKGNNR